MAGEHALDKSNAGWHPPEVRRMDQQPPPERHLEVVPPAPRTDAPEGSSDAQSGLAKIIAGMVQEIHGLRISDTGRLQEPLNTEITEKDRERMEEFQKIINNFLSDKGISFPLELAVNPDYSTFDDSDLAEIARARARAEKAAGKK